MLVERNYVSILTTVACHHQGMMYCLVGLFNWRTDPVRQQNWKLSAFFYYFFGFILSLPCLVEPLFVNFHNVLLFFLFCSYVLPFCSLLTKFSLFFFALPFPPLLFQTLLEFVYKKTTIISTLLVEPADAAVQQATASSRRRDKKKIIYITKQKITHRILTF